MAVAVDLLTLLRLHGLPEPEREVVAVPGRRFRFDYAWPAQLVALEYEGLVWSGKGGRHQRAAGLERDAEKYNEATLTGWRVIRVTHRHVANGKAVEWIRRALEGSQC